MDIYSEFVNWLDNILENNDMPDETVSFCFNLYEESVEDSVYAVQLVACEAFDENDPDWACEEYACAVRAGITDGENPMQLVPRYQSAIMAYRRR